MAWDDYSGGYSMGSGSEFGIPDDYSSGSRSYGQSEFNPYAQQDYPYPGEQQQYADRAAAGGQILMGSNPVQAKKSSGGGGMMGGGSKDKKTPITTGRSSILNPTSEPVQNQPFNPYQLNPNSFSSFLKFLQMMSPMIYGNGMMGRNPY